MILMSKEAKAKQLSKWHNHFAIKPVQLSRDKSVVLQTVERRLVQTEAFGKVHSVFEYRLPVAKLDLSSPQAAGQMISNKPSMLVEVAQLIAQMKGNHKSGEIIKTIMNQFNISKNHASSYYYNPKVKATVAELTK